MTSSTKRPGCQKRHLALPTAQPSTVWTLLRAPAVLIASVPGALTKAVGFAETCLLAAVS